jgi:hypothetical protein
VLSSRVLFAGHIIIGLLTCAADISLPLLNVNSHYVFSLQCDGKLPGVLVGSLVYWQAAPMCAGMLVIMRTQL